MILDNESQYRQYCEELMETNCPCGAKATQVHHLLGRCGELKYDTNNLIPVCFTCHNMHHTSERLDNLFFNWMYKNGGSTWYIWAYAHRKDSMKLAAWITNFESNTYKPKETKKVRLW